MSICGSISANNYIQLPHPSSLQKSLGLTGRFLYLQMKSTSSANPFTLHFDLQIADRSHGLRISVSNLFKTFGTSNGFVVQVPLELKSDRWSCIILDLEELIKRSALFPPTYQVEGCHTLKSMTLCANLQIRGVYTSDNLYEVETLPSDMRFKFAFDISKWKEYFDWKVIASEESQTERKALHESKMSKN